MTQSEIRAKSAELKREIIRLETEIKKVRLNWQILETECSHPDKFTRYHYDGSTSERCPDCEWTSD
jgi:hypothetical protein